jgi:hypothetical protein
MRDQRGQYIPHLKSKTPRALSINRNIRKKEAQQNPTTTLMKLKVESTEWGNGKKMRTIMTSPKKHGD